MDLLNIKNLTKLLLVTSLAFTSQLYAKSSHESIRHVKSAECSKCHEEIYEQWSESMHSQSTALTDPIHGTFYNAVVGSGTQEDLRTKAGKYPVCLQCHSPAAAKDKKTNMKAKASYNEGVNCVACHSMTKFKGTAKPGGGLQLGMQAYEYSDTLLQGPNGTGKKHKKFGKKDKDAPAIANNPELFRTSAACMGCHDQRPNANKVPLCATGTEIQAAGGSTTCQSCHMPVVSGIANHSMMGGHSPEMVSKGIVMSLDLKKANDTIITVVKVQNLLPHNFPTGAPFRNFYIKVEAMDKKGKTIWKSTQSHPMKDDQLAMMMLRLGDKGKPAGPPTATQILGDSRLKPNETRLLNYSIPAANVATVKAVGFYDLLLPPIKQKFKSSIPKDLLEAQQVALVVKSVK